MASRLPPPARRDLSADTITLLDLATAPGGETPPTISVLAHQPALLGPFLTWAAALALQGALPRRDHEILALRTAWNFGSRFEWDEHRRFARDAGLTDEEIEGIGADPLGAHWTVHEMALLRGADELHADHAISDETWSTLARHYPPGALVEVPYVVGQYAMLSMVAKSIEG